MKLVTLKTTILSALCLLSISFSTTAQFAITTGAGAPGIVTALAGSGLTISNVTINCASTGYGTFAGGTASGMGITNGVVMSTGNAGNIDNAGTNFNDDLSTSNGTPTSTDAQLVSVVGSSPVRDPCFIEFDVIPRCGTISIVFVFGSDEYTNWVSSSFNDGFGFFVTGPNPAGGNYTNMNIARLPNSTIVSIDNVNQTVNPTFFVNNNAGTFGNHFDGFTTVLSPSFNVTPCQSYHFKLAIGDASDAIVDSGVLIDVIQCTSPLVATATSTPATCTALGTATANVTSGTGPFTYSWSPSGGTGATATNLAPGTYTVTIDDAISCQPPITVNVTVGTNYTPPVATTPANVTVCAGNLVGAGSFTSAPSGATWTWTNSNPAIGLVASGTGNTPSFTATNTTGSPITGTITITPTIGTCVGTPVSYTVTVNPTVIPTFNPLTAVCQNTAAPALTSPSTNGIPGNWTPATLSTTSAGSVCATFTPTGGTCPTSTTICLTINAPTTPTFTAPTSVCQGAIPPTPPVSSNEGIPGGWTPVAYSTSSSGTSTLTFTPAGGQCATTATSSLTVNAPVTPTFPLPTAVCQGATPPNLPTPSNEGFTGTWAAAAFSTASTGTSTLTFTPTTGLCATTTTLSLTVNPNVPPTFPTPAAVCQGDTPPALPNPSNEGFNGTWNPTSFSTASSGTSVCTFTPSAGICATTATLSLTINAPVTPTFPTPAAVCQGDAAPALPNPSNEGFNGTWNPTTFSTASSGTSVCTFTPAAGICATTASLSLTINAPVTPTFPTPAAVCQGAIPPALPNPSNEGFNGTWNPTTFSTASSGTSVCTFTPAAGICATTASLSLTINAPTTPTFNPIPPMCVGDPAPALQTPSNEGDPGTWMPATISTGSAGTQTYTFTPTAGTCVTTATISVTVGPPAAPTFTPVGPFCAGDAIAPLPLVSNEGVTGSWVPATINNMATTTYTFNPTPGVCATTATMTIVINPPATPAFTPVGPYCVGETIPDLPTTSNNSFTGTWDPSPVNNSATTVYTFTPDAGQCATTATLTIVINPSTMPTFTPPAPFCSGGTAPVLPTTSTNSITGTWDPTPVDNMASGTYTFTPTAGQCASSTTLAVTVNPNPTISVPPVVTCANTDAVLNASGGVSYGWAPATGLSATTGPSVTANVPAPGPYTYTITGTDANGCVGTTTTTVTIAAGLTISVNPPSANLCVGQSVVLTASGAATYSWSPATDLSATTGATVTASPTVTTTYTVNGNSAGCVGQTTVIINVGTQTTPTFDPITALCSGSAAPVLQNPSNEGINGSWVPSVVSNTASGTYSFTPAAGECATTASINITVNPVPTVATITETCDGTNTSYVVTVTISGGTAPFTMTENAPGGIGGSFAGSTWTSNPIPSGTPYDFDFFDASGCGPAKAAGSKNCNCATDVGTMSSTPISLCDAATATPAYNSAGEVQDANDTQSYILHTSAGGTPGTVIQSNTSGTFSFAAPMVYGTTYYISAVVGDDDGSGLVDLNDPCLAMATGTPVVWHQAPTATPTSNSPLCEGATLNLTGNAVAGGTYQWTGPASYSSTQQSPSILNVTTANAGTYTLVISANGCPSLPVTTDVVINAPTLPTFNAIAAVCQGAAAPALSGNSTNSPAIPGTWAPSFVNTGSAGVQTFTFTPNAGQCATSTTISVTVNTLPVPSANSAATCPNTPVVLTATGGTTYNWSPGTGLSATTGASVTATLAATQTYIIDVFDPNGCHATTTATVTMSPGLSISVNPPAATICAGQSVMLTASGASAYTWTPIAGLDNSSSAVVNASPAGTQVYTVNGNTGGCTGTTTVTVTVNPVPVMNTIADIAQCEGTTVSAVTFGTTPAGSTYTWSNTDPTIGLAASGTSNSTPSFTASTGMGTVTVTPTLNGCTGASEIFTIAVNANPIPMANSNSPVCEGATLNLTCGTIAGASYNWSGPIGFGNTNQNPSISPVSVNQSGNYTVTVVDGNGCSGSDVTNVIINPLPTPTIVAVGPFCIDNSTPVTLVPTPTGGTFSGMGITNAAAGTFVPSNVGAAGPTTITYSVTDVNGCSGTGTTVITINPLPNAAITADVLIGCAPLMVTFSSETGLASSAWDFGDGTQGTEIGTGSITHTYSSPGTYDVTLTNTSIEGCVNSVSIADYITVAPDPVANFSVRDIELTVIDPTVHVTNASTGAVSYSWTFGDGEGTSTAVDPTYTYAESPATYTIDLVATSAEGCIDEASMTIIVKDQLIFWVPNTFTPDGDAYNNTFQPVFTSGYDPYHFSMYIINRWGEIIFESHDVTVGWDGTYQGKIAQEGTYTWIMEIKDPQTDDVSRHEGHVNIMR